MSYLTILHRIRQVKGRALQPTYAYDLSQLHSTIRARNFDHPYRINHKRDPFLMATSAFALGGKGDAAKPPDDGFVYHLTSIRKVVEYTSWTYFPNRFPTKNHQDRRVFEYVLNHHKSRGGWLALSDYAGGELWGFRGFTWWTAMRLQPHDVLCGAHRLGMPNVWIPKYALLLRCPAKYVRGARLARVPTTLDGFSSEIFSPTLYRPAPDPPPPSGRTIDLCNFGPLTSGADEYALRPVEVKEIDFYPVLIDRSIRSVHMVRRDGRLWQLLEVYYNSL